MNLPEGKDVSWKRGRQMSLMEEGSKSNVCGRGHKNLGKGAIKGAGKSLKKHVPRDFAI